MWIIVGLGNPGAKYEGTRHNIGHMVVGELAERANMVLKSHRCHCHLAEIRLGVMPGGIPGPRAVIAVCDSYMNVSGGPVGALMKFYGTSPEELLVVHDELDLDPHILRLKVGGGEGGHNGLRSISSALGTKDYYRLRVGVGRPPGRMDPADYVLGSFPTREIPDWQITISDAADAVTDVVLKGFSAAQMELHSRH